MACHYSNSRAPVGSCAAYDISEPALELHSRVVKCRCQVTVPTQEAQEKSVENVPFITSSKLVFVVNLILNLHLGCKLFCNL